MTLTPEQIKEAVRLAKWKISDGTRPIVTPTWRGYVGHYIDQVPDHWIAALASQLISQVDAMEDYMVNEHWDRTYVKSASARINNTNIATVATRVKGPNRDENSILACTEFLREKGNE